MTSNEDNSPKVRRVVTGHNAKGESTVWMDGLATNHKFPNDQAAATTLWSTEGMPVDYMKEEDAGARKLGTAAPPNGTRFTYLELQPGYNPPGTHRTDSLDCTIILAGQPTLYMDDGSRVDLNPHDVVIHRGTSHAWANHGNEVVKVFGVLVDGYPKRGGSLEGMQVADADGTSV